MSRLRSSLLASLALLLAASLLGPPTRAAEPLRGLNDGSKAPPRLEVAQSWWTMTKLPRGEAEWSVEEKVERIAEAGFESIELFPRMAGDASERIARLAAERGLALDLLATARGVDDARAAIDQVRRLHARGLTVMVRPAARGTNPIRLVASLARVARDAKVPLFLETHRGTVTQSLRETVRLVREVPDLPLSLDLSHWVVAGELRGGGRGMPRKEVELLLARAGRLDGRVSNGQQVQVDVGPKGKSEPARRFVAMWQAAMVRWLQRAGPGDIFVFETELGPPPYSIVDLEGHELSDRWEQSLVIRALAVAAWSRAVAEVGRGAPWKAPSERSAAGGAAAASDAIAAALKTEESGIPVLRGRSYRIGEFHLAGQPLQYDYEIAKKKGIKTVLCVRMERELPGLGFPIDRTVEELGMKFIHLPIGPDLMDDALAEKFLAAMRSAEKPLLLQGSNGNRVWGLWALWAGVEHGVPVDATKEAAARCGVKKLVIEDFVRDYLKRKKGI